MEWNPKRARRKAVLFSPAGTPALARPVSTRFRLRVLTAMRDDMPAATDIAQNHRSAERQKKRDAKPQRICERVQIVKIGEGRPCETGEAGATTPYIKTELSGFGA